MIRCNTLREYDANNNNVIGGLEAMKAIDDEVAGRITGTELGRVLEGWRTGAPIDETCRAEMAVIVVGLAILYILTR